MRSWLVTLSMIMLTLAGCTQGVTPASQVTPSITPTLPPFLLPPTAQAEATLAGSPTPASTVSAPQAGATGLPTPADLGLQKFFKLAQEDLAKRLAIQPDQIALLELEIVVWSDGSIGCPQPGKEYPQVPQDGMRIVLGAGGQSYPYHKGESAQIFLCQATPQIPTVLP